MLRIAGSSSRSLPAEDTLFGMNCWLRQRKTLSGLEPYIPEQINFAAIRQQTGLSQSGFASREAFFSRQFATGSRATDLLQDLARVILGLLQRIQELLRGVREGRV